MIFNCVDSEMDSEMASNSLHLEIAYKTINDGAIMSSFKPEIAFNSFNSEMVLNNFNPEMGLNRFGFPKWPLTVLTPEWS